MLINIIRFTPPWVWGLLAALLLLGWQQTRQRSVARLQLLALPLALLSLGLWTTLPAMRAQPMVLPLRLMAGSASFLVGRRIFKPRGAVWHAASARLQLPGSWLPMLVILGIFMFKYGLGVFQAMQPQLAGQPEFQLGVAAVSGALSGLLLGRAARLLELTRQDTIAAHEVPHRG